MADYKYWKWGDNNITHRSSRRVTKPVISTPKDEEEKGNIITEKRELPDFVDFKTIHIEPSNKRTENSERRSNRHMIIQTPINPFLKNSNYIQDLTIQDQLLRPRDSNCKEKSMEEGI